jgi:hypothetical protein
MTLGDACRATSGGGKVASWDLRMWTWKGENIEWSGEMHWSATVTFLSLVIGVTFFKSGS